MQNWQVVWHVSLAPFPAGGIHANSSTSHREIPTEVTRTSTPAPVMLLPRLVERMITDRQAAHIVKFRTTCTDCVPNF